MFERLVDAKGTFEGKCISVIMSIVLILGMTNVLAFAQVGSAEAAGTETEQVDSDGSASADGAGNTSASEEGAGGNAAASPSQGASDKSAQSGDAKTGSNAADKSQGASGDKDGSKADQSKTADSKDDADKATAADTKGDASDKADEAQVDEAVVTFDAKNAHVVVDNQKLTGNEKIKLTVPVKEDLKFQAKADSGYKIADIKASNATEKHVPIITKDGVSTIAAKYVNSMLVINVAAEADKNDNSAPADVTILDEDTKIQSETNHNGETAGNESNGQGGIDNEDAANGNEATESGSDAEGADGSGEATDNQATEGENAGENAGNEADDPNGEATSGEGADEWNFPSNEEELLAQIQSFFAANGGMSTLALEDDDSAAVNGPVIAFDPNGGQGEAFSIHAVSGSFTYPDPNEHGITKEGYTFIGWSTDKSGQGNNYIANIEQKNVTANATYYAIWLNNNEVQNVEAYFFVRTDSVIQYEPTSYSSSSYYPQNANGGSVHGDNKGSLKSAIAINNNLSAVAANIATQPNDEYWDKTITSGYNSSTQTIVWYVIKKVNNCPDRRVCWHVDGCVQDKAKHSVTYRPNGGSTNVPAAQQYTSGDTVKVSFKPQPTREGYTFKGWDTNSNASADRVAYPVNNPGSFTMPDHDVDLYAIWSADVSKIVFDANGGVNPPDGIQGVTDAAINNSFPTKQPTREGYIFVGWNTKQDGSGSKVTQYPTTYPAGITTYYAQWELIQTAVNIGSWVYDGKIAGSDFHPVTVSELDAEKYGKVSFEY